MIKFTLIMLVISIALFVIMRFYVSTLSIQDKILFGTTGKLPSKFMDYFANITGLCWLVTFISVIITVITCIVRM